MKQAGFFWHVHPNILIDWCFRHQHEEIVENIRRWAVYKLSPIDIETWLRLFRPVKGNLPEELVRAAQALNEGWEVCGRILDEKQQADNPGEDYKKASIIYSDAWRVYRGVLEKNKEAIERLHRDECLSCSWEGHTIFPEAA